MRALEIVHQMSHTKVPVQGINVGKLPVQACQTAHVTSLLPPLSRSFLLGKTAWLAIRTYGKCVGLALPAQPHMLTPRVRLRPGRPKCRHTANAGLSGTPEHAVHRHGHSDQPGTV